MTWLADQPKRVLVEYIGEPPSTCDDKPFVRTKPEVLDRMRTALEHRSIRYRFMIGNRHRPRKVMKSGGSKRGRSWRAREREPITGVLGRSPQRVPGAEPLDRGRSPPKAEKPFAFRRPLEAANLPLFSLYCRLSKSIKFLPARVIAMIACLYVCLRHVTHAGIVSKRLNVGSRKQRHVIAQGH